MGAKVSLRWYGTEDHRADPLPWWAHLLIGIFLAAAVMYLALNP